MQLIPSLQDPAPFHAFLGISAFARDLWYGRLPGPEAISHKLEAIRLINGRLKHGDINDSTIHAVVLLWILEVRLELYHLTKQTLSHPAGKL